MNDKVTGAQTFGNCPRFFSAWRFSRVVYRTAMFYICRGGGGVNRGVCLTQAWPPTRLSLLINIITVSAFSRHKTNKYK